MTKIIQIKNYTGEKIYPKTYEYILYDNSSGNNGTITLNDSLANYKYIEIFYKSNDNYLESKRVYNPNGKYTTLLSFTGMTEQDIYGKFRVIHFDNKAISTESTRYAEFLLAKNGGIGSWGQKNYIYITRIVGYK